jgi:uncharacterized protein (DUF1800 family)
MFDRSIAATRYGTGLGVNSGSDVESGTKKQPITAAQRLAGLGEHPSSPRAMIDQLSAPDAMAKRHPIPRFSDLSADIIAYQELRKRQIAAVKSGQPQPPDYRDLIMGFRHRAQSWEIALARRHIDAHDQFRERLVTFWADHFTALGKSAHTRHFSQPYQEEAIRPHIAGKFADILKAAETHPMMLLYLDQQASFGPNSPAGIRREKGLNENLAREILELHTLGVGGGYVQTDVRQLAKLMTGLIYSPRDGVRFANNRHEPGSVQVLDTLFDGGGSAMDEFHSALEMLAAHDSTASHICTKLVVHFIGQHAVDAVAPRMIDVYLRSEGDLPQVYAAMLDHPVAWQPPFAKARLPREFLYAALKVLPLKPDIWASLTGKRFGATIRAPLGRMGQPMSGPIGPDGWTEDFDEWISPQNLAARIQWAMDVPKRVATHAPDPVQFAHDALGGRASSEVLFAAAAAQTRWEGIGLVLSSPAFNRR